FAKLIRRDAERIGYKSSFTIYDTKDSLSLIKSIVKEMKLDDKVYKPSLIQDIISKAKNSLVSAERYALTKEYVEHDIKSGRPQISDIFRTYVQRCRVAGAMDFDDLLYYTNVLIRDNEEILRYYQEFFHYILVDEYQDTNFAQHMIINQLSKGNNHICVVGDDAQSIYSFRGANIRNILNLERIFPELKTFKLEQNYRSTQNIINAANSLIEKNADQIKKHIFSENAAGELVEVMKSYSDFEEAYKVVADISRRHLYDHQSFDNFAILYRTNAQSRVLEQALSSGGLRDTHGNKRQGIPYRIYGGTSFYQRKEIKDAIAYFRLSLNPDDDEALRRIINYPARGIGDTTLAKLNSAAVANDVSIWRVISDIDSFEVDVNSGTKNRLAAFRELIADFIRMNLAGNDAETMARLIIQNTKLISVLSSENTPENISKRENLEELLSGAGQFVSDQKETGNENSIGLADYLADVSLATDLDDPEKENSDNCVTLMTIHAAKGLEFTNVYIVGAEEDLFPSAMSKVSEAEIEEERRLMYVAITRAKQSCMISYAESRYRNGQTTFSRPSRFITDIDPQFLNFNLGGKRASTPKPPHKPSTTFPFGGPRITPPNPFTPFNTPRLSTPKPAPAAIGGYSIHTASELSIGMRIEHARFGEGTVTAIDISG
ncbi:MAG: UvrD-helicase domain-containing protein, partial [Muribaculaceae bacterium]|nr:UvrD-helicase domain-containing protein [Muribaculaceae bacterium]